MSKFDPDSAMIFDTHSHYDDAAFDADRNEILAAFADNGIGWAADIASDLKSIEKVTALCDRYPFIYGAAGIHPSELEGMNEDWVKVIDKALDHDKIVAVGEIGLDYHYDDGPSEELQKYWFDRQLSLAMERKMPVVIHSRDAASDTLEMIKPYAKRGLRGVIHCYSYSAEMAAVYADMGFYIGVGGVVTYKNGRKLKETVASLPLERIVIETDCPYLSPDPFRGKRNSSLHLPYVVQAISMIKGCGPEEVIRQTTLNAFRLYPGAGSPEMD